MTAELYPVDTCYKFSKTNAKSEGRTIDEVNKLMQEESRRDAEDFARLRKSQLIKKTTLSLVVMAVPGEATAALPDAAESKVQAAIDNIKATIKKDPYFRQYRINVYDHGGKNTDLWRESFDNIYHGAILVVDEDSKAGLRVAEHQAQKERYEVLEGTPILAMRTSQVEKKMQDKKVREWFVGHMHTEKDRLSKKKQLTFAFIGLRQAGNVEHLNKDKKVGDHGPDVSSQNLIKVVLGKRGPVRDTVKMEFRRKELDTETQKHKEEEYLITYMFGRKKTNLAVDGIIWAVDAADSDHLAACKEALKKEFQAIKEAKKPILVIAKNHHLRKDFKEEISNIVNGDFAFWAYGGGLQEFEFNYEASFRKWKDWENAIMKKADKANLGRSSGSNFGKMGGGYSIGVDWLINNVGKSARARASKLSKVTKSSGMKLAQKFDKLAAKEKRSVNPNMSKSKYRFTNLLKKHNAEKSNAGRNSESGFGGMGIKGAGVSRFGSGMGLGTNRYKGDYDSDGDEENYSDDEDTGYLLLGNAEHVNKLNAEGGDQEEARSDDDGASGGEDVVENVVEGHEEQNLISSGDEFNDDEDLEEENYETMEKLQMEGGSKNAKHMFEDDAAYYMDNDNEQEVEFGGESEEEEEEIDVASFLAETVKHNKGLLANENILQSGPNSKLESESEAKAKAAIGVQATSTTRKRKIEDVGSNNNSTNASGGAPSRSSNAQARKRRKIRKLVLNAENLVRLLSQNNGKMQVKVLLRQFENISKQKDLFKQLRDRYCEIEKVERTKPDGKKETINFFALKRSY